jgi:hypothetical protein
MNIENIFEFFNPFTNYMQFSKAMMIVRNTYCAKSKNYDEVASVINNNLQLDLPVYRITNFVTQILQFPVYGYEFMLNYESINKDMRTQASKNNKTNRVITPNVIDCIFCPPFTKLEVSKVRFETSPFIFCTHGIGI